MPLPEHPTPPNLTLSEQTIFIYGPPGVGKTTFASKFPNVLFLATEPGLKGLEAYQMPIASWTELGTAYDEFAADQEGDKPRFDTICIDTIDLAYLFCEQLVCNEFNAKSINEGDLSYGKGYAMAKNRIRAMLVAFAQLKAGLILTSHCREKEKDSRTGKYTKIVPALSEKISYEVVLPMADMVLFCETEAKHDKDGNFIRDERIIRTTPNKFYEAKDRTGRLPDSLPLDYDKFIKAYNTTNSQTKGLLNAPA